MPQKEKPKLTLLGSKKTVIPDHPDNAKLEVFADSHPERKYEITFVCPEYTSLCPITGQPDFAEIIIRYVPSKWCIESKSLKLYIMSYRNVGTFFEKAVNRILDDLVAAARPLSATVIGKFNARGGIRIEVKAEYVAEK